MHIFTLGELSTLVISAARSVAERGESGGVASKQLPLAVTLQFRNAKEEEGAVPETFYRFAVSALYRSCYGSITLF